MIWISSTENELWSQNNKTIKNPTEKGSELIIGKRVGAAVIRLGLLYQRNMCQSGFGAFGGQTKDHF